MFNREDVYAAIDTERDYQEKWNDVESKGEHTILEFFAYIHDYVSEAMHRESRIAAEDCKTDSTDSMRKIAGLAVCAMEQHGVRNRD